MLARYGNATRPPARQGPRQDAGAAARPGRVGFAPSNLAALFLASVLAGFAPAPARAQVSAASADTGSLAGVVIDSLGNGIAELEVVLTRTAYSGGTNAEGAFLIPRIPAGRYVAALVRSRDGRRFVYPEVFPIEVPGGETSGIVLTISPEVLERQAEESEVGEDVVAGLLGELGVEVDATVQRMVREGLAPGDPVRVVGSVRDAQSGRAIADAEVRLEGSDQVRVTDRAGRFSFPAVVPGSYVLATSMLGYGTRREPLNVWSGTDLDVQVRMAQEAIELEPIVVQARSPWLERAGFYDRLHDPGNLGRIITRDKIENRVLSSVVDLFHDIPGARVDYTGVGSRVVRFRRIPGMRASGNGCLPDLYLDGMAIRDGWDFIAPDWIEAVEVYVGGARAPIQYARNPCGAVLVWTRRG